MKKVYLDCAAATPIDHRVLKAMEPYFSARFYNPSALYLDAKTVAGDIADARKNVASWLGARPSEIIFTAGGTEANNLAIFGSALWHKETEVLATSIEHESVLAPLEHLAARGWKTKHLPVSEEGVVDLKALVKAITDKTVLVSVMYANNEVGTIQPIKEIAELITKLRKIRNLEGNKLPLYFHTDACQAANYLSLQVARLGVDMMTLNGGKIYGPKQSGVLYVNNHVKLQPIVFGGGQEFGMRSGTENVAAIMGFAMALDIAQKMRSDETKRLQDLQQLFVKLLEEAMPKAQVNGSKKHRLPNNVHVTIPGQDNERLVMELDEAGIQCASGSACSASNENPSHVLTALGLSDDEARSSLRFTMGRATDESAIRHTVAMLAKMTV